MTSDLTYQETFVFSAPQEIVFDKIDRQQSEILPGLQGQPLEIRKIAGQPRQVGYVQQMRLHYGALDLILIETLTVIDPPVRFVVQQCPDCLQRHDPNEREIPFLDSLIENLDAEFAAHFGSPPFVTEIAFDLTPHQDGSALQITVTVLDAPKLGWFKRRAWRKRVANEVSRIKLAITP